MFKKKSKEATEEENSHKKGKRGKKGKEKKPKLTPQEKAVKKKAKVEKQSASTIKKAQDKVKKADQAVKNKEKAAAKKQKDKEKKAANKVKAEEKKIEQKGKKKEEKKERKVEEKLRKREEKIEEKADKAQRKAELAARTPIQKKADRQLKIKKFLIKFLIIIILVGLILTGVKFAPMLLDKLDLPKISVSETVDTIKSKIPFLNKEKPKDEKAAKDDKKAKDPKENKDAATTPEAVTVPDDTTLYISGTSVLESFYTEALAEFLGMKKKELKEQITVEDTNTAYTNLINGDKQVIFSSFPTDKETKMAELAAVDLQPIPIINGGFVFFVNKDNPVKSLTVTQLYNIYSGTITNWKELGGKNEPIVAYQRAENSGAQSGMYKEIIDESEIKKVSEDMKISETKDIVKQVADNSGAIGYSYYYYMENLKNSSDVKMIGVNGVNPSRKTIASAKYPLTTYSYAIVTTEEKTKSLEDIISAVDNKIDAAEVPSTSEGAVSGGAAEVKPEPLPLKLQFVEWMLSKEGQTLAEEKGFIRHGNK